MKHQPLILGVAAAVITIGIGVGVVLAVTSDDESAGGTAGSSTSHSRPSTSSSTSSTRSSTTTRPGSSPTAATTVTTATATPTTEPPDPPDPRDQYRTVPLPTGMSATIGTCNWSPANGGELQASGSVTNVAAADDFWQVDLNWLVNNQGQSEYLDDQFEIYDLAPGQTIPWNFSISAPEAPPNLSCALEVS